MDENKKNVSSDIEEKAKSLFRDMMQQASFDFGFEADNIPLMIEAIPSSADSLMI